MKIEKHLLGKHTVHGQKMCKLIGYFWLLIKYLSIFLFK